MNIIQFLLIIMLATLTSSCLREKYTRQINSDYWIVDDNVEYWREWYDPQFKKGHITKSKLDDSDSGSFEVMVNPFMPTAYGRDNGQVYIRGSVIDGADPESFTFIGGYYCADTNSIFYSNSILSRADINTFDVLYFAQKEGVNRASVVDAKDANNLYNGGRIKRYLESIHVPSFQPLNLFYFEDKNSVYYGYDPGAPIDEELVRLQNIEPSEFKIINDETGYFAQAGDKIYINAYGKNFIEFTPNDIESFEIINVRYSKDDHEVYYYGNVLIGADAKSFSGNGLHGGIDSNGTWSPIGELTPFEQ